MLEFQLRSAIQGPSSAVRCSCFLLCRAVLLIATFYPESWSPGRNKIETVLGIRFLFWKKKRKGAPHPRECETVPQWALILAPEFACPQDRVIDLITKQLGHLHSWETIAALPFSAQHPAPRGRGEKGWRMFVVVFVLWVFCLQGQSLCSAGQAQCKDHKKNVPWIKNEQLLEIPFSYSLGSIQHSKVTLQSKSSKVLALYKMQSLTCSAFT